MAAVLKSSIKSDLYILIFKGKIVPLRVWTGPEGSRRLRLLDSKPIGT